MAKARLTEALIKTLNTEKTQDDIFHRLTPGAGLRLSRDGRRTWFVMYRSPITGRQRRANLGEHPTGHRGHERYLTLKEFEARYDIFRGDLRKGIDPALSSTASENTQSVDSTGRLTSPPWMRAQPSYSPGSVADLLVRYFDWAAEKDRLAPRTLRKYQLIANAHLLPVIGAIQFSHLEPGHFRAVTDGKSDETIRDIKKVFTNAFNYGAGEPLGFIRGSSNPFPKTQLSTNSDDRWFQDQELGVILRALSKLRDRDAADVYEIMLLTGCRTDEAVNVKAEDVIQMNGEMVWFNSNTKTGKPLTVALIGRIGEILNRRIQQAKDQRGYLFWPTAKRDGYVSKLSSANRAMRELTGIADYEPYVFRHTLRTHLSALRVPYEVKEACLNHSKKGVVKNYDHFDYWEERKEALAKWHAKLAALHTESEDLAA